MAGTLMMRGASQESLNSARAALDSVLASGDVSPSLGADLFAMARTINSVVTLRRVLSDPNGEAQDKAQLLRRLFGGKVGDQALDLVIRMVGDRWVHARDLVDAIESLGTTAVLAEADRAGALDSTEDEIFRFSRIVQANPRLQQALTDSSRSGRDKDTLLDRLLVDRAGQYTRQLVHQAVIDPRGRRLDQMFDGYEQAIARRREQNLAFVTSAVPLTEEQSQRLARSLSRIYGASVHLTFDIDPTLVGGVMIRVGDDVIDGSIRTRMADATRRLAG